MIFIEICRFYIISSKIENFTVFDNLFFLESCWFAIVFSVLLGHKCDKLIFLDFCGFSYFHQFLQVFTISETLNFTEIYNFFHNFIEICWIFRFWIFYFFLWSVLNFHNFIKLCWILTLMKYFWNFLYFSEFSIFYKNCWISQFLMKIRNLAKSRKFKILTKNLCRIKFLKVNSVMRHWSADNSYCKLRG